MVDPTTLRKTTTNLEQVGAPHKENRWRKALLSIKCAKAKEEEEEGEVLEEEQKVEKLTQHPHLEKVKKQDKAERVLLRVQSCSLLPCMQARREQDCFEATLYTVPQKGEAWPVLMSSMFMPACDSGLNENNLFSIRIT